MVDARVDAKMTYKFSPSSLSLLKDCPRCFWLNFNKNIKRPDSIFPSLPNGMDKVLKEHFDRFMKRGELPQELQQLNGEVKLFDDEELLKIWQNNRKGIQWTDESGNLLKGAIDILLQKGKKLIVLDFKTRGFPVKEDTHLHYKDQLDIYNFLLRKNDYATEDYSYLLFYHPQKVHPDGNVDFHKHLVKMDVSIQNAERIFQEAITVLEKAIPKPSAECQFCAWAVAVNKT
ncbi:PD-(D/E)XK nuclease family protein [Candidatus Woesearchaeota archaeon]|nr:PD-(D/E)XK nuclease family protein [Candidatus Woesearchaeota archaeon]